jgi:predicted HNH restriction endonuclease
MKNNGKLACDVCDFDYTTVYGDLGVGFIECHHRIPVSDLQPGAKTKLSDLALVCANCHRMLHRKRPWLTIEVLRNLVAATTPLA